MTAPITPESTAAVDEAITSRRSIRAYLPKDVPRDIVETCLRAAGTAPNGANHQPWHFSVIGDQHRKRRIRRKWWKRLDALLFTAARAQLRVEVVEVARGGGSSKPPESKGVPA